MGLINNIFKINSEVNRSNGKKIYSKSGKGGVKKSRQTEISDTTNDSAEISNESLKLFQLKKESRQYIEMIKNVHLVSEKQLKELRENVISDFYSQNEIVEVITDKMMSMTNYKN